MMESLKRITPGAPLNTFPVDTFNAIVDLLQNAVGEGIKIGTTAAGGLELKLGDGNVQFRPVTVVDLQDDGNGVYLQFNRIMALCRADYYQESTLTIGATKDEQGNLNAIRIGKQTIPVEECGDGEPVIVN